MTMIVLIKNATQTPINVGWIPIALIGQIVARILHAMKGRVTVISMLIVKADCYVVLKIAAENQYIWTAVQVSE